MFNTGDVVLVELVGIQTTKPRPMVVVSAALYHSVRPDLILGLCTTNLKSATEPTDFVLQDWRAAGLTKPTAFRSFISTHPATAVLRRFGRLTDRDWLEVQARIRLAIAV